MAVKCSYCEKIIQNKSALKLHIKMKHNKSISPPFIYNQKGVKSPPLNNDSPPFYLNKDIEPEVEQPPIDIFEELRTKRTKRLLEDNENLALELENKIMRDEISGIKHAPEQKSEIDTFTKFLEAQNNFNQSQKMQQRALKQENLSEIEEDDEENDDEDEDEEEDDFLK